MKFLRITIIAIVILVLGAFFYLTSGSDPQQMVIKFLEPWNSHQLWIVITIFGILVASTLTGLPVLYLSVALGFFMNFLPALILAWAMNLVAVMTTWFVVKKVYFEYFRDKYGGKKIIKRINKRISKYGLWTVALSRSVYFIPTNIINFSFPLSKISTRKYAAGTMIGLVPESLINVTAGYMLKHELLLMSEPKENLLKIVLIGLSILLIFGLFLLFRYRKNRLTKLKLKKIILLPDRDD